MRAGAPVLAAELCNRCTSAMSRSAAIVVRRAGMKRLSASGIDAASIARMARTTISSTNVKPRGLPIADVSGIVLPAFPVVRAQGVDVVLPVPARAEIEISAAPGIDQAHALLH